MEKSRWGRGAGGAINTKLCIWVWVVDLEKIQIHRDSAKNCELEKIDPQ